MSDGIVSVHIAAFVTALNSDRNYYGWLFTGLARSRPHRRLGLRLLNHWSRQHQPDQLVPCNARSWR